MLPGLEFFHMLAMVESMVKKHSVTGGLEALSDWQNKGLPAASAAVRTVSQCTRCSGHCAVCVTKTHTGNVPQLLQRKT